MIEVVILASHFVFVALAAWLPVYCVALDLGASHDEAERRVNRKLANAATINLALSALTGLMFGWAIWEPSLANALAAVGSRLWFGIVEFCFSLLIFAGVSLSHYRAKPASRIGRLFRAFALFVSITNLWYHFPLLLGVVHQLRVADSSEPLSSAGFRQVAFSAPVLVGAIHFLLTAAIWGSIAALWLARQDTVSDRWLRGVALVAAIATLMQWPVGFAAYWQMPRHAQIQLLSGENIAAMVMILSTVWLAMLAQAFLVLRPRAEFWLRVATALLGVVAVEMSWLSRMS
jgi:hypothetical protein